MADARVPARVETGVAGLDNVLSGGLTANRLYSVVGEPGTGKTTFGLQFLREGVRRGESVMYVALAESRDELDGITASHGWSLDGIHVLELMPAGDLAPEEQYTIFHPSEVELGETVRAVLTDAERIRPARLVIDSLTEMRLLAQDQFRFRRHIFALKRFFAGRCTVLLLDSAAPGADDHPHTIAHGVLRLEKVPREYGGERRRLRVDKLRGSPFRSGFHDLTIQTGGLHVYPRLVAAEHRGAYARDPVSSGVPELDRLAGGGIERGTSTLLLGPAGAGKSTIAMQYMVAAAERGEPSVSFIFDERPHTIYARAESMGMRFREHVEGGRITLQHVDAAELSPGEFAHRIREFVERDGARVVVIDSLNGYMSSMVEESFLSVHLHELLSYLNERGVLTVMVLAEHGALRNIEPPADLSYIADNVLLLRYFEANGRVRQAMSIVKKRSGPHERTIRELSLGSQGIRVGEPLNEFQGVLRGTPTYIGASGPLLEHGGGARDR